LEGLEIVGLVGGSLGEIDTKLGGWRGVDYEKEQSAVTAVRRFQEGKLR
jgi:hypothetical protein